MINKLGVKKLVKTNTFWITLIALVLLFKASFGFIIYQYYLNSPASKENKEVEFVIKSGESVRSIAKRLEEEKVIRNDFPFLVYLKLKGIAGDLKAGVYRLSPTNTPKEVIDILTNGKVASKKITIPEGWTIKEMGQYLEKQGIVTQIEFEAATKQKYDFEFLKDLPAGASVEGFLFPDTYQIPYNANSEEIVRRMLENFDSKLTADMRRMINASGYNTYEVITLSSIVEKEVFKPVDRKVVAGIFLNRLNEGMKLQSDVTVNYTLDKAKEGITYEDIKIDTPYNTYVVSGLPFGPVGSPGIDSIWAVLSPEFTEFRYFLTAEGTTYYSKTLDEHEEKKARYLQ